MTSYLDVGRVD